MKPLVVASNMLNERPQLEEWFSFVKEIADGGILIVDGGSTDGTIDFFLNKKDKNGRLVSIIIDNIIQREGYGPARNHLRQMASERFPEAHWLLYLDADERIDFEDFHLLRHIKDSLIEDYDVVGLPRLDWLNKEKSELAKDWKIYPDWQARMTRLSSPMKYIRRLHEQVTNISGIYTSLTNPKINHFHRGVDQKKRDFVGKLCAMLHEKDKYKDTYPKHHKEDYYYEQYKKEGL